MGRGSSCKRGCRRFRDCGEALGGNTVVCGSEGGESRSIKPLQKVPHSLVEP